jgi:hypothetical protein
MRKLILLAGALVMASAPPALAKPGQGHGKAHAGTHSKKANHGRVTAADRNGNGIADVRERRGANGCPPGLARKNNGCVPPGQARKLFAAGQRVPSGYNLSRYQDIPASLRGRVPSGQNYIYRDQTVYVVDPATRLVTSIIGGLR